MLQRFLQDWRKLRTPEEHLQILKNSDFVLLTLNSETHKVVRFINALSDGMQAAFILLLEVRPEYRHQGIGSMLVKQMLERLQDIPAIDLTCNPELQNFYKKCGMSPSVGVIVRKY
jgi:ribosomal protein S18 acetylase RimI-like enzyme